jgi:hypothetical protein
MLSITKPGPSYNLVTFGQQRKKRKEKEQLLLKSWVLANAFR